MCFLVRGDLQRFQQSCVLSLLSSKLPQNVRSRSALVYGTWCFLTYYIQPETISRFLHPVGTQDDLVTWKGCRR